MVNDLLRGMEMKQIEPDIEMQIYRNNINELQGQLQEAYKKIKEQKEMLCKLEELLLKKTEEP